MCVWADELKRAKQYEGMITMNIKKTSKKSTKAKSSKKCRGCGLDCSIVRTIALADVPDSKKKEKAVAMFGSEKPRYTPETCSKR